MGDELGVFGGGAAVPVPHYQFTGRDVAQDDDIHEPAPVKGKRKQDDLSLIRFNYLEADLKLKQAGANKANQDTIARLTREQAELKEIMDVCTKMDMERMFSFRDLLKHLMEQYARRSWFA